MCLWVAPEKKRMILVTFTDKFCRSKCRLEMRPSAWVASVSKIKIYYFLFCGAKGNWKHKHTEVSTFRFPRFTVCLVLVAQVYSFFLKFFHSFFDVCIGWRYLAFCSSSYFSQVCLKPERFLWYSPFSTEIWSFYLGHTDTSSLHKLTNLHGFQIAKLFT